LIVVTYFSTADVNIKIDINEETEKKIKADTKILSFTENLNLIPH
jgi:hypothetical protein